VFRFDFELFPGIYGVVTKMTYHSKFE